MPSSKLHTAVRGKVRTLAIVLGDQLDARARLLRELDSDRDAILMMEVCEEATHVPSHRQRTALFLAAMRHFALYLQERGFRVRYVRLDSKGNTQTFGGEVARAVKALQPLRIALTEPGEWRVKKAAEDWDEEFDLEVDTLPDEHFTATTQEFSDWASSRKELVMEYYYREQRKRLNVLLTEEGKPIGGRWNYDQENRKSFDDTPTPPHRYTPRPDEVTREVMELVEKRFPDAPGNLDRLGWPVTRREAKRALADFIEKRLEHFGPYQDAMWTGEPWLYHSSLSPCLNLKLLSAWECVEAALDALKRGRAPVASVEGFIRQLIGWREYIRGVYWHEGSGYGERNELNQHGKLPEFYWSAETDMVCLRESIGEVLQNGYGHHIQRLMVTGNFALIAGVHPRAVADWYLGMFVDGVDWVTTPNTVGMVMHADGGVVGTKPYAASGRYIERMSNYCSNCRYDPARRAGEEGEDGEAAACPFTTFYWDFLLRHRKRFRANRRMAMILKNVDRIGNREAADIQGHATRLREQFGIGDSRKRAGGGSKQRKGAGK